MKFNREKVEAINQYIIEKVGQGECRIADYVSDKMNIDKSTVYRRLAELTERGVIIKEKKGVYKLASHVWKYTLSRSANQLLSDTDVYVNVLREHLDGISSGALGIWEYAFSEMINNVIDHSGAESVEITVKKDSLNTTVIINDNGVGIFEKIKSFFNMASIEDAITELFKGKLTTDNINHSGEGIFFSARMMDEFYIISSGRVFSCNAFDEDYVYRMAGEIPSATCVIMSLANDTKKTALEVFNRYSDVEGGFTKTMIPLKNIYASSPVSRSQAKRLCERLSQFEEVVLDFDGLEWMGQGFAHQVFVVFQNANPKIEILPINMSEGVEKMYNHVTRREY